MKKKVLIVDDSKTVREVLAEIIAGFEEFEVIGKAADPFEAHSLMKKEMPDIITLDIEMPKMDGLTFLDKVMRGVPLPVIMISSLTEENAAVTLKALELGAVDYILKPGSDESLKDIAETIHEKLIAASMVPKSWLYFHRLRKKSDTSSIFTRKTAKMIPVDISLKMDAQKSLIVLGASTGGTVAIEKVLSKLNHAEMPPIAIVQHIPPFFSNSFAQRLDKLFSFNVYEAKNSKVMLPGDVIIAQGDKHLLIQKSLNGFAAVVKDGPKINRHRPSVDVLFKSAAAVYKNSVVGVLLTGMGVDGASGMVELKKNGAVTVAQDREECAVAGMPQSAIELGAIDRELDLEQISNFLNSLFQRSQ
ncbi:MAG: protein-glutamate methylesterase/protein-glutamine glutaminase [bacterium]